LNQADPGGPALEEVVVREATWRDLFPLLRLERRCFGRDAWPWTDMLAALILPETVRLLALVGNEVAGFVIGDRRRRQGVGWIASLGVHPVYRRRGIATRLLRMCEERLAMPRLRLSLRVSNQAAHALYSREGYRPVGRWSRYYRDGEDAIVMEKSRPASEAAGRSGPA